MVFDSVFLRGQMLTIVLLILSSGLDRPFMTTSAADSARQIMAEEEIVKPESRGIPAWFVPDAVYSEQTGMLFVQTDSACINPNQAAEALEQECLRSVNTVLDEWYDTNAGQKLDLTGPELIESFLFQDRKEIRIDGDQELAKMSIDHNGPGERHYYCGFAQLHLDEKFREFAHARWQTVQTSERLVRSGLVGGSILALLTIAFGYLKMETATRGFYSRRLQTVTVMGILLILAVAFWFKQAILGS